MTTVLDPPSAPVALSADPFPLVLNLSPDLIWSDAQFLAFCQKNPTLHVEQTAKGDIFIMPPAFFDTEDRNVQLIKQLANWADGEGTGIVLGSSTLFVLPSGAKRGPDAAWVRRERLAGLTTASFLPLCPDFVAELRSASDRLGDVQAKMDECRENGARLGWLLDPSERKVHVYRPGAETEVLDDPETVSADPELSGFVLDARAVFDGSL